MFPSVGHRTRGLRLAGPTNAGRGGAGGVGRLPRRLRPRIMSAGPSRRIARAIASIPHRSPEVSPMCRRRVAAVPAVVFLTVAAWLCQAPWSFAAEPGQPALPPELELLPRDA